MAPEVHYWGMNPHFRARMLALALGLAALAALPGRAASVDGVEDTASHPWSDIKADTYDPRAHFPKAPAG